MCVIAELFVPQQVCYVKDYILMTYQASRISDKLHNNALGRDSSPGLHLQCEWPNSGDVFLLL